MNQENDDLINSEYQSESPLEWSEDGLEVGSDQDVTGASEHRESSIFRKILNFFHRSDTYQDSITDPQDDFAVSRSHFLTDRSLTEKRRGLFRRRGSSEDSGLDYEPEVYLNDSRVQNSGNDTSSDDFAIGAGTNFDSFGSDSDYDSISTNISGIPEQEDEFAIPGLDIPVRKIDQVFKAEIETVEIIPEDDLEVVSKSNMAFSENSTDVDHIEDLAGVDSGEDQEYTPGEIDRRTKLGESFQNTLEDIVQILDSPTSHFHDSTNQAFAIPAEDDPQASSAEIAETNYVKIFLKAIWRIIIWAVGIPGRSLTNTGTASDIQRSRLEPLILGIPAVLMAAYIYRTQIFYQTTDQLRRGLEFQRMSNRYLAEGNWPGAYMAVRHVCDSAPTAQNLWKLAEVLLQSQELKFRRKGERLVESLASPTHNNLADAHYYIAQAIWNRQDVDLESVPQNMMAVQNHLRTALSSEPNRFDILEMLLDILMLQNETEEVLRLVTPRLERWPLGHYYLARVAFQRGDRINQQISSSFMVNRYEDQPNLIRESRNDRERYLLCLALSGQWHKAEPLLKDLITKLDGDDAIEKWQNRFLTIKALELLTSDDPDEFQPVMNDLLARLENYPDDRELWNILTRYADRNSPHAEQYYRAGVELIRKHEKSLDSNGFMIWGNLSRKRNQPQMARALLERAIRLNPENVIALNNLANLLYKIEPKDYDRALSMIQTVLKLEPDNPIYIETRGQIYALLDKDKEAIKDLNQCLTSFPNVPEIHETLGKLLRRQGQVELAKSHENRVTELKKAQAGVKQQIIK